MGNDVDTGRNKQGKGEKGHTPVNSSIPEEGEACVGSSHVAGDVVGRQEACHAVDGWVIWVERTLINHDVDLHMHKRDAYGLLGCGIQQLNETTASTKLSYTMQLEKHSQH